MYSGNVKLNISDMPNNMYMLHFKKCEELDKLYAKNPEHLVHVVVSRSKDSKTDQQMRALRALIGAFFFTGASSCPEDVIDVTAFTEWIKEQIGYTVERVREKDGKTIVYIKSFGDASKEELSDCIEKVLKLIDMCGAGTDEKIMKIIAGMEENAKQNGHGS